MKYQKKEIIQYYQKDLDSLIKEFNTNLDKSEKVYDEIELQSFPNLDISDDIYKPFIQWIKVHKNFLFDKICVEYDYCSKIKDKKHSDHITVISGIADLISSICLGISPILISTLLVKLGLNSFCKCKTNNSNQL